MRGRRRRQKNWLTAKKPLRKLGGVELCVIVRFFVAPSVAPKFRKSVIAICLNSEGKREAEWNHRPEILPPDLR